MGRKAISVEIERKLYAESMGRCMNPSCKIDLFDENGDIMEKAHIDSYCDSQNNDFENLVVLCPIVILDLTRIITLQKKQ